MSSDVMLTNGALWNTVVLDKQYPVVCLIGNLHNGYVKTTFIFVVTFGLNLYFIL